MPSKFATPSDAGKIGIEYSRRWWEEDHRIYGGITNTNIDLGNMWYPSTGFHGQRGTMVGYYNTGASARAYQPLSPEKRLSRALDQGARIHGDVYKKDVSASFSVDWGSTEFSEGAWVGWPSQTRCQVRQAAGAHRQHLLRRRPPEPRHRLAARCHDLRQGGSHRAAHPRGRGGGRMSAPSEHRDSITPTPGKKPMIRRTSLIAAGVAGLCLTATAAFAGPAVFEDLTAPKPGTTVSNLPAGQDNPMIASRRRHRRQHRHLQDQRPGPVGTEHARRPPAANSGTSIRLSSPAVCFPPGSPLPRRRGSTPCAGSARTSRRQDWITTTSSPCASSSRTLPERRKPTLTAGTVRTGSTSQTPSLADGSAVKVPLGSAAPADPLVVNPARPSRFALEIENLPVNGWLVEVEVDAAYPAPSGK